ncbi:MAG: alpha/beta fold hydrolase, partial [Psychroserpens sp.]|nr:alpha/beta fold hydrolase [Psychroserpens sp.]
MKKTLLLFSLFLIIITVNSQNFTIENSIQAFEKSMLKKDYELLKPHLSEEYKMSDYSGAIVHQIIPQILTRYPLLISSKTTFKDSLSAILELNFKEIGKQKTNLLFDKNGKIKSIQLFTDIINNSVAQTNSNAKKEKAKEAIPKENKINLTTSDGLNLVAIYELPKSEKKVPVVIFIHQGTSSKEEWYILKLWDNLIRNGYAILAFDLRIHGESDKDEGGYANLFRNPNRAPLDLEAAIKFLKTDERIDTDKIAVIGSSVGANLALIATTDESYGVKTAISISPNAEAVQNLYGKKEAIIPNNVFLISSDKDRNGVRKKWAQDLYDRSTGEKKIEITEGKDHGSHILSKNPYLNEMILNWLEKMLFSNYHSKDNQKESH